MQWYTAAESKFQTTQTSRIWTLQTELLLIEPNSNKAFSIKYTINSIQLTIYKYSYEVLSKVYLINKHSKLWNVYVQPQQPQRTNKLVILKHQNRCFDWRLALVYRCWLPRCTVCTIQRHPCLLLFLIIVTACS